MRDGGIRHYQCTELGNFQGHVNFREAALGWIGAILRRGTREERAVLDRAVIDNSNQHHLIAADSAENVNITVETTVAEPRESPGEDSPSEDSQTDIWRYTKTLQERFAGKDVVPIYHESTVRGYPPKFRAEVTYRGRRVSGEAGNKKLAKHRASKRLCESLDINILE
jgi:Double-stranded RNA binding motif